MFREEILKQRIKAKRALPLGAIHRSGAIKAKGCFVPWRNPKQSKIKATGERFAPARAISEIGANII